MNYLLLIIGFLLLIKGADYLLDAALNISKLYKVPSVIIGLTLVAFGTSLPELSVSILASTYSNTGITLGNVIGSNIFNLLMIVGSAGVVQTLIVDEFIIKKQFHLLLLSSIILLLISLDKSISRVESIFLLILFLSIVYYIVTKALKYKASTSFYSEGFILENSSSFIQSKLNNKINLFLFILIGIIGITIGGNLVVSSSISIANLYGVSDELIGFTIIAIGTSLPELITALVAATRGNSGIALGSVLGSNIFNILFITGISAAVSPLNISNNILVDIIFMILVTFITYIFACRKNDISRFESSTLMVLYSLYLFNLIIAI